MITVKITREIVHEASYEDACSVQHAVDMAHRSAQYCNKVTKELVEVTVIDAKATGSEANSVTRALEALATLNATDSKETSPNFSTPLEDKPPIRGTIGGLAGVYGFGDAGLGSQYKITQNPSAPDPLYGEWSPSSGIKEQIIAAHERYKAPAVYGLGGGLNEWKEECRTRLQDPGEPAPI